MLGWNLSRAQNTLQIRDVEPENCHYKGEGDGGEEVKVLCGFIECWGVLEDRETARTDGHEVEPLPGRILGTARNGVTREVELGKRRGWEGGEGVGGLT